jgi:hypothetical protein
MITLQIPPPPPVAIVRVHPEVHLARARFFAAIVQVEGHKWTDDGGALAISRMTWRQHTRIPYRYASFKEYAYPLAERHLDWLARSLAADGLPVTALTLALCWRWGYEGGKAALAQGRTDYGQRVLNLVEDRKLTISP